MLLASLAEFSESISISELHETQPVCSWIRTKFNKVYIPLVKAEVPVPRIPASASTLHRGSQAVAHLTQRMPARSVLRQAMLTDSRLQFLRFLSALRAVESRGPNEAFRKSMDKWDSVEICEKIAIITSDRFFYV